MRIIISTILILSLAGGAFYLFWYRDPAEPSRKIDSMSVGSTLDIKIDVMRECQIGDFDILLGDLTLQGNATADDLLLTIEPVLKKSKSFPVVKERLSASQIEYGYKTSLAIPTPGEPQHLGVFLCRDRARSGSCAGKALYAYETIGSSLQKNGPNAVRKKDKIYFFQYLYGAKGEISFLTAAVESLDEAFLKIDDITKDMSDPTEQKNLRSRAKKLYELLGSYVVLKKPQVNRLFLEMRLSKLDDSICQKQSPIKPKKRIKIDRKIAPPSVFRDMGFD